MIESEIDLSDPSIITPLEALANEYPEMASTCNSILLELISEQINFRPIVDQEKSTINF
jgi:hypothetical protein